MPAGPHSGKMFDAAEWDAREFDWTGKSFYFISGMNLFGKPIGIGDKFEQLMREIRKNGYKAKNNIILVQYSTFRGRVMIEIEKPDKYDAQIKFYDTQTTADTVLVHGGLSNLGKGVKRLRERVSVRRMIVPREIYYWLVAGPDKPDQVVLFGIT